MIPIQVVEEHSCESIGSLRLEDMVRSKVSYLRALLFFVLD